MKIIKLDASKWQTGLDFYDAMLLALGAPEWHSQSVDALVESMVFGEINKIDPPYTVEIHSIKSLSTETLQEMTWVKDFLTESRDYFKATRGYDVEVYIEMFD